MIRTATTFAEWSDLAYCFAQGSIETLIVCGSPGLSKTHTLMDFLGERTAPIKGTGSPISLYIKAFAARESGFIVIDDADSLLDGRGSGKEGLNVVKALTEATKPARVTWAKQSPALAHAGVPPEFESWAKVAIISNDLRLMTTHLRAVVDRGLLVKCQFSAAEVHRYMASWWPDIQEGPDPFDEEVYEFIGRHLNLIAEPSVRNYLNAASLKRAGILDWQGILLETIGLKGDLLAVAGMIEDGRWVGEQAPKEFERRGLGGRSKYYRLAEQLQSLKQGVPAIQGE